MWYTRLLVRYKHPYTWDVTAVGGGPVFDDVKSTFEVPRVERPSRREFEERFLFPQRPLFISGSMKGWPALSRWAAMRFTN